MAAGADGIMVEGIQIPARSVDWTLVLRPDHFKDLVDELKALAQVVGRKLVASGE